MNFVGRFQFRRLMCLIVRQNFSKECENAINIQINLELKASHEYLAMAYHFDRSDVALPGIHAFFQKASSEEREHAEKFMKYMNKRGGQIILSEVPTPKCHYESMLEGMQEALTLEKTVNAALLDLHAIATKDNDPNLCDFIEANFLQEQVDAQKQLADFIRQIERCEKELGDYVFDINLKHNSADMHSR